MKSITFPLAPKAARDVFGEVIAKLGGENENIVVVTADSMRTGMTAAFAKAFPQRHFNLGIAEQNMMGVAAGLARCGKIPFTTALAPFASMRSCEQVRTDIAYPKLNVKIVATHGGLSAGPGGTTHHATEDIAIMRAIANMTVIVPADIVEVEKAVRAAAYYLGPVYIRLGRNPEPLVYQKDYEYRIGKAIFLKEGEDVALITMGRLVAEALIAAEELSSFGIRAAVINMHTVKPLDVEALDRVVAETRLVVTLEEHNILGGLGGAVAEVLAERSRVPLKRIGLPDTFSGIGSHDDLLKKHGLTGLEIAKTVRAILEGKAR